MNSFKERTQKTLINTGILDFRKAADFAKTAYIKEVDVSEAFSKSTG
jgi:hypothetical protein